MPERTSDFAQDSVSAAMSNAGMDTKQPTTTFGQKLVGLSFNPSKDSKVDTAKRLCADLADLVEEHFRNKESYPLEVQLYNHTIGEILNAQMNVVKLLTLKY